jgi:hypothetical protein
VKKTAIIIVNYNGWKETLECLESLSKLRIANCELRIVVIDNGSTNNSVQRISKWLSSVKNFPPAELIELKENRGFSGGNNYGIRFALENGNDYILLLNNDTLVRLDFLDKLIRRAERDSTIGIVGPKIYFAKGFEFHKDRYVRSELGKVFWYAGGNIDWGNMYASHRGVDEVDIGQYDKSGKTDFVSGCCMLVKREVFEKIGYLDSQFYLYLEDLDFCLRAKQSGFKLIYEPKAVIWHKNASSSDKPGSKLHQYYQTRNRLIIGMRYSPIRTRLALLRESARFLMANGIRKNAVLDFYLYKWGKAEL